MQDVKPVPLGRVLTICAAALLTLIGVIEFVSYNPEQSAKHNSQHVKLDENMLVKVSFSDDDVSGACLDEKHIKARLMVLALMQKRLVQESHLPEAIKQQIDYELDGYSMENQTLAACVKSEADKGLESFHGATTLL